MALKRWTATDILLLREQYNSATIDVDITLKVAQTNTVVCYVDTDCELI